jgi:lycopene cyclase domain-containing protein
VKEYTVLAIGAAVIALLLDRVLGTEVVRKRSFWIALAVMFLCKIPSNGYLTWRPIVVYNPDYFLGIRLWTIPVEDFFYGFGLITVTIVLWEYFLRREKTR